MDVIFFGLVYGLEKEYGYWHLSELAEIHGPFGLKIERDLFFRPTPLEECKDPTRLHS
nr:H351 [uncultured bacterium]